MAYPITTTSGVTLASVPNGTVNNTTTSLTLIGKNYAGYGNFLNENFLYLLENFSNSIAPANALRGQLWYDSGTLVLKVYDGTQWKPISSSTVAGNAPSSGVVGDLWWNNITRQLNVYNGQDWTIIGPAFSAQGGTTGLDVRRILDTSGNENNVIEFLVGDDTIGILSKAPTFTPQTPIAGFSTINPGFNLASSNAISGSRFTGDAYFIDNASVLNASTLGLGVTASSLTSVGTLTSLAVSGTITVNSNNNVTAIVNSGSDGQGNIGSVNQKFNTVFARATSAQYADLAENYLGDTDYEVGTVVVFGGEKEITTTQLIADTAVAGVISTNPAYLMNSSLENGQPVALRGRVPVKVTGIVKKGDLLVTSDIAGTAVSVGRDNSHGHAVFAKSLEDKSTDEVQLIEAVII
jgi:hypothetical protein